MNKKPITEFNRQRISFRAISEIGIENGESVLDVQCGTGDMLARLFWMDYENINYTGMDADPQWINIAEKRYPDNDFFEANIDHMHNGKWDWVVSRGVFNNTRLFWKSDVRRKLSHMLSIANKGVAVTFLYNGDKPMKNKGLRYTNVWEINSILAPLICTKKIIRNDYLKGELIIYLMF